MCSLVVISRDFELEKRIVHDNMKAPPAEVQTTQMAPAICWIIRGSNQMSRWSSSLWSRIYVHFGLAMLIQGTRLSRKAGLACRQDQSAPKRCLVNHHSIKRAGIFLTCTYECPRWIGVILRQPASSMISHEAILEATQERMSNTIVPSDSRLTRIVCKEIIELLVI